MVFLSFKKNILLIKIKKTNTTLREISFVNKDRINILILFIEELIQVDKKIDNGY